MSIEEQTNADQDRENMRRWVEAWKSAGPELEKERRKRIRETNTKNEIQLFVGLAAWSIKQRPPAATSGLVEQQRVLGRFRQMDSELSL